MIDEKERKQSQFKYLSEALFGNISIQKESIASIDESINVLRKEFESDISNKAVDLNQLNYIAKDIKDNFQFTLSIIDEITSIDELINQLNLLALNISVEASKVGGEEGEIFQNLAKEVREKGDKVQGVIEKIFIKEIKNKSFSEHNRYIRNSILPQIDDRVKSLGEYIHRKDDISKEFNKTDDLIDELHILSSGNRTILNGIMNFSDSFEEVEPDEVKTSVNLESKIEEKSVENIENSEFSKPQKRLLNKRERGTQEF